MRDLNRKGAEKEGGSDMDAFMEPSPEEATLLTPPSVSPVSQSVPPTPNKVADNQVVKVSIKVCVCVCVCTSAQAVMHPSVAA
jgi:hypothetical protein